MLSNEQREAIRVQCDALKAGPLWSVYAQLRRWKRQLRGEPLNGGYVQIIVPLTVPELLALGPTRVNDARFFYSLGRGWLEQETRAASARALACLRCADALGFEGQERTRLYHALAMTRLGAEYPVDQSLQRLAPHELTSSEAELRESLLSGTITSYTADVDESMSVDAVLYQTILDQVEQNQVESEAPARLLILGDVMAHTAHWLPDAVYFCAAPTINGVSACDLASLPLEFDLGVAPQAEMQAAQATGVRCARWITIDGMAADMKGTA